MQPRTLDGFAQCYVSGNRDYRNAPPRNRRLHGNLKDPGHLLGLRNQFAIIAALREKMFRVGLLKISAPDFIAGNLRGNSKYRNTAAVTIVEPVDQMRLPGPQLPAQTANFPVRCASAPAANAAVSSCLT